MDVCAYYRVSTPMQAAAESGEYQKEAVKKFAARHGMKIVREYEDPGFSGEDDERPAFNMMLEDLLEKGLYEGVVVYTTNRISRNEDKSMRIFLEMKAKAKILASAQDDHVEDWKDDYALIINHFKALGAHQQRMEINKRHSDAIKRYIDRHGTWGRGLKEVDWRKYDEMEAKGISFTDRAKLLDVSRRTLYRKVKDRKK